MEKSTHSPPRFMLRFFRWFCHPDLVRYIEGDLVELYEERRKKSGKLKADQQFIIDVILLIRPGIIRPVRQYQPLNEYSMFRNYFKVGIRNILKYKMFSFINVAGLAVAMSVCMLIILMLSDQYRYDRFHANKERIYRILSDGTDFRQAYATSPYPLAATLKAEYPIVEDAVNLTPGVGGDATYGQRTVQMSGYFTDPSFFNVLGFKLQEGNELTALVEPNSMVISQAKATGLFGSEDPIGKTIEFADRQLAFPLKYDGAGAPAVSWGSFTVTGVIDESRYKSHLTFDVLISASSRPELIAEKKLEDLSASWEWYFRTYTYVLLSPARSKAELNSSLAQLVAHKYANIKLDQTRGFNLTAQRLSDVQLDLQGNDTNNRFPRMGYYFLSFLAGIIMISACLNYTSLSVARALTRAKEIGIRKVTGASRRALIVQFLSESIIMALLAATMASVLLLFIKPAFKMLWVNQYLDFELPSSISVYFIFAGFALVIGLIAGAYPALHLSTYQPIKALKSLASIKPGKLGIRKTLGVIQFVISLFFITTSVLVFNQFKHFLEFDYGFDSSNIINVELQGWKYQKVANELGSIPGVVSISACDNVPAAGGNNGVELKRMNTSGEYTRSDIMAVDDNFISNLGLTLVAGRNLPPSGDSVSRYILVNETAVKKLGYKFPSQIVGEMFEGKWGNELFEVVGVVQDFRSRLLINSELDALVLRNTSSQFQYANVRISSTDLPSMVKSLDRKWKRIDPQHPMKYEFYDDQLASTHQGIFDLVSVLGFISFLAITIACLGLLGMATYTAERKTKEVGIRKILGAADMTIAMLLSKEFFIMLALSIVIGAPLSFFLNNLWLQHFPNRVEFGIGTVLAGTTVLLVLGLITIVSQTLRASRANPVDSLKIE